MHAKATYLRFRHTTDENGNDVYTLYPEKTYEDGWVVGWCPELERTMVVHPANVLDEADAR
jgi:hypothetical protein